MFMTLNLVGDNSNIDEKEADKLASAFEILYNEGIICFEKKGKLSYDDFLENARYVLKRSMVHRGTKNFIKETIEKADKILEKKKNIPHIEIIKSVFSGDDTAVVSFANDIKNMEAKGLISIKVSRGQYISYEKVAGEIVHSGYSTKFESFDSITRGTILFETPNYIIYKSLLPNIKPDDYIYTIFPNTLHNLKLMIDDFNNGKYTFGISIPNEAFDISINKVSAVCKLVWLHYNTSKETNIADICINVVRDYFTKFYKLSEKHIARLNDSDAESFIRDYFHIIEEGLSQANISRCKNLASNFFRINIED
jgi:hypothetical protein